MGLGRVEELRLASIVAKLKQLKHLQERHCTDQQSGERMAEVAEMILS